MKEDVAGRQGPQSGQHDQAPDRVWGGVSVGRIGNPLLKLEIATGVNPVPLLLGQ